MNSPNPVITNVSITGLHGAQNLSVALRPGLNVLFGKNGTGKTTLLHVLANLLEGDVERFSYLRFDQIEVTTLSGSRATLRRILVEDSPGLELLLDGASLCIIKRGTLLPAHVRRLLKERLGSQPVYLPAFRSVLEASSRRRSQTYGPMGEDFRQELNRFSELEANAGADDPATAQHPPLQRHAYRERREGIAFKSMICRQWFGAFVPWVRFASLAEVADQLVDEYESAEIVLAQKDRAAFSAVFVQVLKAVFQGAPAGPHEDTDTTLNSIRQHLESLQEVSPALPSVYNELSTVVQSQGTGPFPQEAMGAAILRLYRSALEDRVRAQRETFRRLRTFQNSLNGFLRGKALIVGGRDGLSPRRTAARVRLEDGRSTPLSALSSGERQVLAMLFSATHMSDTDGMILIDEPELSLHVGWQRKILGALMSQAGDRQVLACTHAPEVAAEHHGALVQLNPSLYTSKQPSLFEDQSGNDGAQ